ncbi:MAG: HK97 family phage prohead protease, partial [Candidatus Paceibacterota bacterium]
PVFHDITQAAKDTKEMVEQGFLDTVSVGFLRNQDEKGVVKNELMEVSFVAVPANVNARILAVKDISADEEKAVEEFVKEENAPARKAPMEGDVCTMEDGSEGVMGMSDEGEMVCMMKKVEPKEEEKTIEADEIKSGRVLSQKNRGIITTAKDAMSSSIAALDELLKATEPSEGGEGEAEIATPEEKGRTPRSSEKDDSYQKFIELRKVTRAVVTAISEALKDAKLNK